MFTGKIAVATNDQTRVTGHIGRCRAFLVFEVLADRITNRELRENMFTNHRMHHSHDQHVEGDGHHNHLHLIEGLKDCKYLVSSGGGWRVVEDLKNNGIITIFTDTEFIEDAVNKLIKGELKNETDLTCDHNEH
ncbi:MAG TPA: NifB/NifX family molybdenum-iron cluster-binding protein [Ignavibacteriaceae bacterium]|nr:NifB/NifX family molybdenum-iron cluster-binding protein [Ignavibacteriaceae bacterium]